MCTTLRLKTLAMRNSSILCSASFVLVFLACKPKPVEINYLDQKGPGMEAKLFAPEVLGTSANEHSAVAFSPEGTVVLWAVMDGQYRGRLFEMQFKNGKWSLPASRAFADTTSDDYNPCFSTDGKLLFFSSKRKAPSGYPVGNGNRIWVVERTDNGWGIPKPIDTTVSKSREFGFSVAGSGTLYFASSSGGPNLDIYQSKYTEGTYTEPEMLPAGFNSNGYEDGPYIAPDESYLIFESSRDQEDGNLDLFITFRNGDGQWGAPVNMGPKINTKNYERFPRLSPDGKYFFFASDRIKGSGRLGYDMYWVDAKIIEELR